MIKFSVIITTLIASVFSTQAKPLKVFILAGQSNMEGPASITTFDYIGDDPATAPLLKMMRGADGKPTVCDDVWISYLTGAGDKNFTLNGKLTAGYGSMWGQDVTKPSTNIGPELTYGLTMSAALHEPILIIKAAWGGKNLHTDFRSPSAGPFELSKVTQGGQTIPKTEGQLKLEADRAAQTGVYYRLMMEQVKKCACRPKAGLSAIQSCSGFRGRGLCLAPGWERSL